MLAPGSTRQPDLYERTSWLSTEMLRLARAFTEATAKLEVARAAGSFSAFRSAFLDLQTFTNQSSQMIESLETAIANERRTAP